MKISMGFVTGAMVWTTGCSALLGGIIDGAGAVAGQRIGQSLVDRAAPQPTPAPAAPVVAEPAPRHSSAGGGSFMAYNPQFAYVYTQFLFSSAFYAGGYDIGALPFKPGEYVVWEWVAGDEKGGTLERAYLGDDAKGRKWWRVKFTDPDGQETTTLEALFTPDMTRLVRLRGRFPGDKSGNELPVDDQAYYVGAPSRLSAESLEGATKGTETIKAAGGSFQARHVVFGGAGGRSEWWLSDQVPGGVVRQRTGSGEDASDKVGLELLRFGKDAKTELASF